VDITDMPDLARLADEVARTRRPCILRRGEAKVALLVPATRNQLSRAGLTLIDTSGLPPVPRWTIEELVASRPPEPTRRFSDEEIKAALEADRVEAWLKKDS
jgi:hypothetical protein